MIWFFIYQKFKINFWQSYHLSLFVTVFLSKYLLISYPGESLPGSWLHTSPPWPSSYGSCWPTNLGLLYYMDQLVINVFYFNLLRWLWCVALSWESDWPWQLLSQSHVKVRVSRPLRDWDVLISHPKWDKSLSLFSCSNLCDRSDSSDSSDRRSDRCDSSDQKQFSKHQPSGPMLSISRNVRLSIRLCVCVFTFNVPFNGLFAPSSWSRMSNIFRDSESLGKSNKKKWSNIWTFMFGNVLKLPRKKKFFFCLFCGL